MPIVECRAFVAIVFSTSTRASGAVGFSYILNVGLCSDRYNSVADGSKRR